MSLITIKNYSQFKAELNGIEICNFGGKYLIIHKINSLNEKNKIEKKQNYEMKSMRILNVSFR